MGRYLDPISKGKQDWMNYTDKMKQIKSDREADKKHNEDIAKKKEEKTKEK